MKDINNDIWEIGGTRQGKNLRIYVRAIND